MTKLLTTVALVAVVATPALAQTRDRAPIALVRRLRSPTTQGQQQRHSVNTTNDVYDIWPVCWLGSGPTIRAQLANDPARAD
jgi:hypothetical protein